MLRKRGFLVYSISISEISLFIISVFAFGFIIGGSQIVSADAFTEAMIKERQKAGLDKSAHSVATVGTNAAGGTATAGNNFQSNEETGELMVYNYQTGKYEGTGAYAPGFSGGVGGDKTETPDNKKTPDNKEKGGIGELISSILGGTLGAGEGAGPKDVTWYGGLLSAAAWGGVVYGAIKLAAPLFGADEKMTDALSRAAFLGVFAGRLTYFAQANILEGEVVKNSIGLTAEQSGFVLGIGVAVAVFVLTYKKESKKVVELQCLPWEAPLGGSDCEKCNQDPLRQCSEYRCKSLGQACEIVNQGSMEERCVWVARNDVSSPVITPWQEILTLEHKYSDIRGRPPSLGTKITYTKTSDGCIKPFTPLVFGLRTNEPSQCKIDLEGNKTFDQMTYYVGESNLFAYNHTQRLRLPSPSSLVAETEGPEVPTEGQYNFYVRCHDANGNVNEDEFVFQICVDKSPDTTPPLIESTSITSGGAVSFGSQEVPLTLYVNEPAECKWSTQDKTYDLMEQNVSCSTHVYEQNARQQYPCNTVLTGVKDRDANTFYFRCKDQPLKPGNERNTNQESYVFNLRGTQPLNIIEVGPNETYVGSTAVVGVNLTVRTDDGADEGKARCYFSASGKEGDFVEMFETLNFKHKQILSLPEGDYTYFFRCVDEGGNAASANTTFNVFTDRTAPAITRAYKEGPDALKVITNEDATCVYSLTGCNYVFDDGLKMTLLDALDKTEHIVLWTPYQSYYFKCKDTYGNEPAPNSCSLIASASALS